MKLPYTYEIYKLNIQNGHFEVKYIPLDEKLTAISFNVPVLFEEDGSVMQTEKNIDLFAPQREWAGQKFLLENANTILNMTGSVTPT